ncbi:MAG: FAD-binding oxidoreductase [Syntrophaceae bacterium]
MENKPKLNGPTLEMAKRCRHYAMCKIDYLGTGICASGVAKHYVSYYPQGRMDLYAALASGLVPVTDVLEDIADSCDLCGVCDYQCHFYTEMRPSLVMAALKSYVDDYRSRGGEVKRTHSDDVLASLQAITGDQWASNDPAILVTYSHDPFPLAPLLMPRYVALPRTREEVSGIVRLARERGINYVTRGNGGSTTAQVLTDGIVIDVNRMKGIEIDMENWVAKVGAGVTSFDLQKEAAQLGCRICSAEPSAMVCSNIICSGTFSTWANVYGLAADNAVDAEFVGPDGNTFNLNDKTAPNLFAFHRGDASSPGICTSAKVKLYPVTDDEGGVLVPFSSLGEALEFAKQLSIRRIGLAVGVLGGHYVTSFTSPSKELADRVKPVLTDLLGANYMVLVLGDSYAIKSVKSMANPVIGNELFRTLVLGMPKLADDGWQDLVRGIDWEKTAFEILAGVEMQTVLEMLLSPSPENITSAVADTDMRDFYQHLYERPEMLDLVWLNTFRIVSARMSRHKHMVAFILYMPMEAKLIEDIIGELEEIARKHGITHDYGFVTPMDFGKRAVFEYDYYVDHADEADRKRIQDAAPELMALIDRLYRDVKGTTWIKHIVSQGFSRKEQFLYI